MAADQAWTVSRGKGVTVAVVDSGVDAGVPQLSGHVAVGADIVAGTGRGDTDCLGHGTAVAGLIVAQPGQAGPVVGLAPDAQILPIRTVTDSLTTRPADLAAALEVAVSAGAKVVTLAIPADLSDHGVAAALGDALRHDVLVVVPATDQLPGGAGASVLRVGGVDLNGRPAAGYVSGSVDVVAPGVDVAALGISGVGPVSVSGTDYAVADAAGVAALVRAAHPTLTVAQVMHRVEATADRPGAAPDSVLGWGMVNPRAAVQSVLAEEQTPTGRSVPVAAHARPAAGSERGILLAAVAAVAVFAGVLILLRLRRIVRPAVPDPDKTAEMH
jgi:subtilisin family serine protease